MDDRRRQPYLRVWILTGIALALLGSACDQARFRVRTPPGQQLDVFNQTSVPRIDVLWVVDNSSSMTEEQEALATNFDHFYQYLFGTGADFHIGVISSDVYDPKHQGKLLGEVPIISRATPDSDAVFSRNVHVGTTGKGDEQGFRAAQLALSEPLLSTTNIGFLREDAYLFVIFVSDEDDHSFGEVPYFLRRFEQIKGIGNDGMVKVSAIVGDTPEVPASCKINNVQPGTRYTALATDSGGVVLSICAADFAKNLDELGFTAAGLKRNFTLSRAPIVETLAVWVKTTCKSGEMPVVSCAERFDDCGGRQNDLYGHTCVVRQSLPDGFGYEETGNSIRFFGQAVPPFGAVIEAGYFPVEE